MVIQRYANGSNENSVTSKKQRPIDTTYQVDDYFFHAGDILLCM